ACVLFELLAGRPPFLGQSADVILRQHMFQEAPSIVVLRPGLPPGVEIVLRRALAKSAADRYTNAGEFARALEPIRRDSAPAVLGTTARTRRPRRSAVWVAALAALVAIAGTWMLVRQRNPGNSGAGAALAVMDFQGLGSALD